MMKKIWLLILCCVPIVALGQYKKGEWSVSPKISFAKHADDRDWSSYSIVKMPPLSVAVEKGLTDYFSAGGYVGYYADKYTNDTLKTTVYKYNTFTTGVMGTLHWAGWLEKTLNYKVFLGDWDFYLSGVFKMVWHERKEEHVWHEEKQAFLDDSDSKFSLEVRPIMGVRYFVSDNFSMLVEVGTGNLGMVTSGVTWRW
ncbi:hypothetical protein DMA11_19215 [Marinilabiliaceae bacterium JC017]|nr:hypothetical protein DMA11_19215 [Marinilabiliaceae bacterium JC017]